MSRRISLGFPVLSELAQSLALPLSRLLDGIGAERPRPLNGPEDPEMREVWEGELNDGLRRDRAALLAALGNPEFGRGGFAMEEHELEAVVRACSEVRMTLRTRCLGGIRDEVLEAGMVDAAELPLAVREPYGCYWLLGGLQELLISLLDPDSAEFGGPPLPQ